VHATLMRVNDNRFADMTRDNSFFIRSSSSEILSTFHVIIWK